MRDRVHRSASQMRQAEMASVSLVNTWDLVVVAAPELKGHFTYVDVLDASGQWVNILEYGAQGIPLNGKIGFSPHATNDSTGKIHCWMDAWIYRPDGSEAVHKVASGVVSPGQDFYLWGDNEAYATANVAGTWRGRAVFLLDHAE